MRFERTVLQVIPALESGGAERTSVEMARAIVAAGGKALVATSGGRMCGDVEKAGGRVIEIPAASKNPLTILANVGRLTEILREAQVDIIHARSRAPAWSAFLAAKAAKTAFVTTYHGAYRAASPVKRFVNSVMARGDLVIANSDFTAAAIRAAYPVGDRLKVIPRGADLAEFNPLAISGERVRALRARFGLENNRSALVLLLPGRLTDWKGHEVAIEAIGLAATGAAGVSPSFQLIFAGDEQGRGDFAGSLMSRVNELGLQQMIRWVGHCDDMPAAYALADMALAPSTRPEAFGRTAVEAGAMATVAIASNHGGARETIIDGVTGLLVEPGSAEALARAILKAAALGPDGRRAMGDKARAHIASHYSTQAMTSATLDAYRDLLARRAGAP
ncbi:MAG: glycosyltransferase family 4 protein [Pseudomonadota bacterium]